MILKYFLFLLYFTLAVSKTKICGHVPTFRVIGGSTVSYPWYVAIAFSQTYSEKLKIKCGGSLITRKDVLTAAHCLVLETPKSLAVYLGVRNACTRSGHGQKLSISRTIAHPQFKKVHLGNDIGIIVLKQKVNVIPVCLPQPSSKLPSSAEVIGMGNLHPTFNVTPCKLKGADLKVISNSECQKFYKFYNIPKDSICAGNRKEFKDSCNGDSGGALQHAGANHLYTVFGIVSFGIEKFCGFQPYTVYSDVRKFITWIEKNVEDKN